MLKGLVRDVINIIPVARYDLRDEGAEKIRPQTNISSVLAPKTEELQTEMSSTIESASTSSRKLAANAPSVSAAENCLIQIFGSSPKLACELS